MPTIKRSVAVILAIILFRISNSFASEYDALEKDVTYFFVKNAVDKFYAKTGNFPKKWTDMSYPYSCKSFLGSERNLLPKKRDEFSWRPLNCEYSYTIIKSNHDYFLITISDMDKKIIGYYKKIVGKAWEIR